MIPPIPISVRTSSVQVRKPVESDFGGEYGEPETIENVRFEGVSAMVRDEYRLVDGAKGLLWVDATSKGAFAIPEGSLVSVDGGEWLPPLPLPRSRVSEHVYTIGRFSCHERWDAFQGRVRC